MTLKTLMALGILSHTSIRDLNADDPLAFHLQIEAMKLALVDAETYVADSGYMTEITASDLLDDPYLASRAALIDETKAQDFNVGAPKNGGTVYEAMVGDAAQGAFPHVEFTDDQAFATLPEPALRRIGFHDVSDAEIDLGGGAGLRILATPGHAPHHLCAFEPESGCLFSVEALGHYYPETDTLTRPAPDLSGDGRVHDDIALGIDRHAGHLVTRQGAEETAEQGSHRQVVLIEGRRIYDRSDERVTPAVQTQPAPAEELEGSCGVREHGLWAAIFHVPIQGREHDLTHLVTEHSHGGQVARLHGGRNQWTDDGVRQDEHAGAPA